MGADADALCGAPYGQPSADRVNYRNGYRQRRQAPGPGRLTWRFPSCWPAAAAPDGCWNAGAAASSRPSSGMGE
jgi:putative transposase